MVEHEPAEVEGPVAWCKGRPGEAHAPRLVPVVAGRISACPDCGRRFRREEPPKVGPAVWPKEE